LGEVRLAFFCIGEHLGPSMFWYTFSGLCRGYRPSIGKPSLPKLAFLFDPLLPDDIERIYQVLLSYLNLPSIYINI